MKIFIFLFESPHHKKITFAKEFFDSNERRRFARFCKGIQIARHFGTPLAQVFSQLMTYFQEQVIGEHEDLKVDVKK